ncbi:MAG: hypothetical protein AAF311_10600 [Pseudomonadota bacterium]
MSGFVGLSAMLLPAGFALNILALYEAKAAEQADSAARLAKRLIRACGVCLAILLILYVVGGWHDIRYEPGG